MKYPGFIGGSYTSQSVIADVERSVNWFPEILESPGAKVRLALYPSPGFLLFVGAPQITDVGTRALFAMNGRCFAVIGTGFYEIFATRVAIRRGTVAQDSNPATICSNGAAGGQLLITSGGNAYAYVLATNTLSQVLTGEATMGGFLDGYGLVFNVANGKVRESSLNDFTTWDPTQFFQRSIAPDPWKAMVVDGNRQIWLFGEQTGEVWYDTGASPQPFAPIPGAVFRSGLSSSFGAGLAGSQLVWLEQNAEGAGRVMAARGYVPERVSTYAVDTALGAIARASGLSDAEILVYEDGGHTWANVGLAMGNATWTLDVDRPTWHERGAWRPELNRYDLWRPRAHCFAFGQHLVGDRTSGTIATMDVAFASEADGTAIRRLRRAPGITDEHRRRRIDRLELLMETGVGLAVGQGSDPKLMLRISGDGGRTWSNELDASIGKIGEYRRRVYWNRLGICPDLVVEVSMSDPVPARVLDAWLNTSELGRAA